MYICGKTGVCDSVCDFCWYCVHDELGVPIECRKNNEDDFGDGLGYCDSFTCCFHEPKPNDIKIVKRKPQNHYWECLHETENREKS